MEITKKQLRNIVRRILIETASIDNENLQYMMNSFESIGTMITGSKEDLEQIYMLSGEDVDALNQVFEKYLNHIAQQLADQVVQSNPKTHVEVDYIRAEPDIELYKGRTTEKYVLGQLKTTTTEDRVVVRGKIVVNLEASKRKEQVQVDISYNRNLNKYNWHLTSMYWTGKGRNPRWRPGINELNLYSAEEAIAKAVEKLKGKLR